MVAATQPAVVLNAPRHRTRLSRSRLSSDTVELCLVPEFGCHWTRLRASLKGEWVDLLMPALSGDLLLDRPQSVGGCGIEREAGSGAWSIVEEEETRFVASLETAARLVHTQEIELRPDGLEIRRAVENRDAQPAPAAPALGSRLCFLRRPTCRDDDAHDAIVIIPARPRPRAASGRNGEDKDLRRLRPLGHRTFDDFYSDWSEPHIRVIYPGCGVEIRLEPAAPLAAARLQVPLTPNGRPSPIFAIELLDTAPDSHPPPLASGERRVAAWTLSLGDI
jgi:hypothetical protein